MVKHLYHKYLNKPCEHDGIKFASKLEGSFYLLVKKHKENGDILFFLRQVPFVLPGNIRYLVDFCLFMDDGHVVFVDVKGVDTPVSSLKIKQVEHIYPVNIEIFRKEDFGKWSSYFANIAENKKKKINGNPIDLNFAPESAEENTNRIRLP